MSLLGAVAAVALAFSPSHAGSGAASAWVLRPSGPIRNVVVFAHGWKHAPTSPRSWVEQFRPWLAHLLAEGDAVVFPQYQLGGDDPGPSRVDSFRRGLQLGFRRLAAAGDVPVVAAGYSFGGSLVFYYAADARRWGLPEPRAVDSVFPVGPIAGAPVATLPRLDDVLLEVGDRDTVAGRDGADAWWPLLAGARHRRLVVVRSTATFVADHSAPKRSGTGAQAAFWAPLDRLLSAA